MNIFDTNDSFNTNSSNLDVGKKISTYYSNGSDFPQDPKIPIEPTEYVTINVALVFIKLSQLNWKAVYWDEDDTKRVALCYGILVNIQSAFKAYSTYNLDLSIRAVKMANNLVYFSYEQQLEVS